MVQKKAYGLFDFDGTLCPGDSIMPFVIYCVAKGHAPRKILWSAAKAGLKYLMGKGTAMAAKAEALSFIEGKTIDEMDAIGEAFYHACIEKRLYPKGLEEIAKLKARGAEILIVTASLEAYMRPIAKHLGADGLIGTRCGLDENNVYTGQLASENCRGFEKTLRIAEYLAARGHEVDAAESYAYGDSHSDLPMLLSTLHPVAVNGKKKLLKDLPPHGEKVRWKRK